MTTFKKTAEQEAARQEIRDKIEAVRVSAQKALQAIYAEATACDCFIDSGLDEFGSNGNRIADAINWNPVDRAFFAILTPIYEWAPDHEA